MSDARDFPWACAHEHVIDINNNVTRSQWCETCGSFRVSTLIRAGDWKPPVGYFIVRHKLARRTLVSIACIAFALFGFWWGTR